MAWPAPAPLCGRDCEEGTSMHQHAGVVVIWAHGVCLRVKSAIEKVVDCR